MSKFKVQFVNYPLQYSQHRAEYTTAINDCLNTGQLIMRRQMEIFEENLAKYVGVKNAIAVASGTDALLISLLSAGIGQDKGDEVIVPSHTFMASISTIVQAGATPILIDVKDDYCMDEELIEQAITKKTKAIVPVQFNGRVCNMDKIMAIAKKHKLIVIEDSCQALGATFNGKKAGSFGTAGCFSFYPSKILGGYGDAGAITTNDDKIAELARLYRNHGRSPDDKDKIVLFGFTSRMDNLQASILNVKMKYLDGWIKRRKEIADIYYRLLSGNTDIILPPKSDELHEDVYQNFVIRVKDGKRDEMTKYLRNEGVEILVSCPIPNHKQKIAGFSWKKDFHLPMTERFASEVLSLPMYPELTDRQVSYVCRTINKFQGF